MSKSLSKTISGHCPFLNKNTSITVNYIEVSTLNQSNTSAKRNSFDCNIEQCNFENNCPLYCNAPIII